MIAITMRMTRHRYESGATEIRDTLAHDWWRFLARALPGIPVIPLPNIGAGVINLLRSSLKGIILSGGEDWGVFPERDETEKELMNWARKHDVPVLGVCRGAQALNLLDGGSISPGFSSRHVGSRHTIRFADGSPAREVNSWHRNAITMTDLATGLTPAAWADDNSVEAFSGDYGRVTGVLWHPEREPVPRRHDILLFKDWK